MLTVVLTSCACPKPPIPDPPKVIVSEEPCMDPKPELPDGTIPDWPNGAETITLTKKQYNFMVIVIMSLADYINVQHERCGR